MRGHSRLKGVVVLLTLTTLMGVPAVALAGHSVPSPKWFWDPNNDGVAGPEPLVTPAGGYWESVRLARLDAALAEWSTDTQFDPGRTTGGSQNAYVDGRVGPCTPGGSFNQPGGKIILAQVCRSWAPIMVGDDVVRYRITDLDVYFNMENPDSPNWWIGSTLTTDPGRLDFQGVMTHELGHWVRLVDLGDSTSCTRTSDDFITMCGSVVDGRLDTWRYRSLHADDVSSANIVY